MNWPDWITDPVIQFLISTFIAIVALFLGAKFVIRKRKQYQQTRGKKNESVQVSDSTGVSISINKGRDDDG